MKVYNYEQGSDDWFKVRLGIPTASEFDKILTGTGKSSTQVNAYINKLLAEVITGKPVNTFQKTEAMERGNELEQEAADYYSMLRDVDLQTIGFCTDDAGLYGCSPDRLVGDEGLLEIKCPLAHTHVEYLLSGKMDTGYIPQVQGQLLVTGRKWCDFMSYHPDMPPLIVRVERDEQYISDLQQELNSVAKKIADKKAELISKGFLDEAN